MIQNAVKTFEGIVKFQFDPYSDGCEAEFEFPLRGAPDIPSIGLEEGYIKVSRYIDPRIEPTKLGMTSCNAFSCPLSAR